MERLTKAKVYLDSILFCARRGSERPWHTRRSPRPCSLPSRFASVGNISASDRVKHPHGRSLRIFLALRAPHVWTGPSAPTYAYPS